MKHKPNGYELHSKSDNNLVMYLCRTCGYWFEDHELESCYPMKNRKLALQTRIDQCNNKDGWLSQSWFIVFPGGAAPDRSFKVTSLF